MSTILKCLGLWLLCLVVSYLFLKSNIVLAQSWPQKQKFTPADRSAQAIFAWSVCANDKLVAVGAQGDKKGTSGQTDKLGAGSVYLLKRDSLGQYVEHQKLVSSTRSNNLSGASFGHRVDLAGQQLVVAARTDDTDTIGQNSLPSAGAAYYFEADANGIWQEKQKLLSNHRRTAGLFGNDVAVGGHWLMVGENRAYFDSTGTDSLNVAGLVHCFKRNASGKWIRSHNINAKDRDAGDAFGTSVQLFDNQLFVGAYGDAEDENDTNAIPGAGAMFVFEELAGRWTQVQKIVHSMRDTGRQFGAVFDADSNWLAVGVKGHRWDSTGNTRTNAGVVVLYEKNGNGRWIEKQTINSSDAQAIELFGASVDLQGGRLLVGAEQQAYDTSGQNFASAAGAAYLFELNSSGRWIEQEKVVAGDRDAFDYLGNAVALDGNYIIVGARADEHNASGQGALSAAGSAYVFSPCQYEYNTIQTTLCRGDSIFTGGTWQFTAGVYRDSLQTMMGCDSVVVNTVVMKEIQDSVEVLGSSLFCLTPNAQYQWFNCSTGVANPADTNQSYSPGADGSYAVAITIDGCTDTSACIPFIPDGIAEVHNTYKLELFPNPAIDVVTIQSDHPFQRLEVLDKTGRLIDRTSELFTFRYEINVGRLVNGMYHLRIYFDDGSVQHQSFLKVK